MKPTLEGSNKMLTFEPFRVVSLFDLFLGLRSLRSLTPGFIRLSPSAIEPIDIVSQPAKTQWKKAGAQHQPPLSYFSLRDVLLVPDLSLRIELVEKIAGFFGIVFIRLLFERICSNVRVERVLK